MKTEVKRNISVLQIDGKQYVEAKDLQMTAIEALEKLEVVLTERIVRCQENMLGTSYALALERVIHEDIAQLKKEIGE